MSLARATTATIWSPRPPATVRRPSSRRIARAPVPRAAAEERAASVVPTLEDATRDAVPLAEAIGPSGPPGAAVFALLVNGGTRVHYVGVAKDASRALAAAASATVAADAMGDVAVAWANLPKSSRKPALQAAWRSWLGGVGYAPEGNAMAARAAAEPPTSPSPSSPSPSSPSRSSPSRSSPSSPDEAAVEIAYAAVSKEAVASLCDDGFVVLDDVLPADVLAACLDAANALKRSRKTVNVGQEGRDDSIAVLAGDALPAEGTALAGLSPCARTLLAVPAALRRRYVEMTAAADVRDEDGQPIGTGRDEDGQPIGTGRPSSDESPSPGLSASSSSESSGRAEETMRRLATATAPDKLMLANYPGDGARYVAHLDNDPEDPRHSEGEPGLRARDRAVTAILYLNPDWEESHGGCLRVRLEGTGAPTVDVAPSAGRMVLFDCRRIVHEVLPSHASRWAMTAWIND